MPCAHTRRAPTASETDLTAEPPQSNSRFDCVAFSFIDQICSCIRVANQMPC